MNVMIMKGTTQMSKHVDPDNSDRGNRSSGDPIFLLTKIQRQLLHLEKKVDSLINMLQEKGSGGNLSARKPHRKNVLLKTSQTSGRSGTHGNEKGKEKSGNNGSDQVFYSKFSKTTRLPGQGLRSKPLHHKSKKRK